jgi:hypothetical protein
MLGEDPLLGTACVGGLTHVDAGTWLVWAAAVVSLLTCVGHVFIGGPQVAGPLSRADVTRGRALGVAEQSCGLALRSRQCAGRRLTDCVISPRPTRR